MQNTAKAYAPYDIERDFILVAENVYCVYHQPHKLPARPEHKRVIAYLDNGDDDYFQRLGQFFDFIKLEVQKPGKYGVRPEQHYKG